MFAGPRCHADSQRHTVSGRRRTKYQERLSPRSMLTSPLEVTSRGLKEGEGSIQRKEAECIAMPSPSLDGEQARPSRLEQDFPHTASPFPPPLPQPHTLSWLHPTIPSHPRPLDKQ